MSMIARREENRIEVNCVGGTVEIIHEATNGVLVVAWPRRKHYNRGEPDIPVRYELARLLTGDEAVEARRRTICNSKHYARMPDVFVAIGPGERVAGRSWRSVRAEMVALADAWDEDSPLAI